MVTWGSCWPPPRLRRPSASAWPSRPSRILLPVLREKLLDPWLEVRLPSKVWWIKIDLETTTKNDDSSKGHVYKRYLKWRDSSIYKDYKTIFRGHLHIALTYALYIVGTSHLGSWNRHWNLGLAIISSSPWFLIPPKCLINPPNTMHQNISNSNALMPISETYFLDLTESCPLRAISGFARIAIGVISDILTSIEVLFPFCSPQTAPTFCRVLTCFNPWAQISSICLPQENDKDTPTKSPCQYPSSEVGNPAAKKPFQLVRRLLERLVLGPPPQKVAAPWAACWCGLHWSRLTPGQGVCLFHGVPVNFHGDS